MTAAVYEGPTVYRKPWAISSQRRKKPSLDISEDMDFYSNIWTLEDFESSNSRHGSAPISRQYIDISQIAYAVSSIDYKSGYEGLQGDIYPNIWAPLPGEKVTSDHVAVSYAVPKQKTHAYEGQEYDTIAEEDSSPNGKIKMPYPASIKALERVNTISANGLGRISSIPVSGPSHRGDKAIFSTVLPRAGKLNGAWNEKFLLCIHEPVRHALYVIDRFLSPRRNRDAPMEWNIGEFFTWFKLHFVELLRYQHDVKTKVLLPLLQVKYTVKREVSRCYDSIDELLETVVAMEKSVIQSVRNASTTWDDHIAKLQSAIRRLNTLLNSVLTVEEEAYNEALAHTFTQESFKRYVMPRIFRACHSKKIVIPWIVERCRAWGGDKEAQAVKDEFTFTSRFLYDRIWLPYFVAHVSSAMKNLDRQLTTSMPASKHESRCIVM